MYALVLALLLQITFLTETFAQQTPVITITTDTTNVVEGGNIGITLHANPAPAGTLSVGVNFTDVPGADFLGATNVIVQIQAGASTGVALITTSDDNNIEPSGEVTFTVQPGNGYTVGSPSSVKRYVVDKDSPAGLVISDLSLDIDEDSSETFTVRLNSEPTGVVLLSSTSDNDEIVIDAGNALSFLPSNWFTPQEVSVFGSLDADNVNETATITISTNISLDPNYNNQSENVMVTVTDNSAAPTVANEIPNQAATAGTLFSHQFPITTFDDPEGGALTYAALQKNGNALPSWLTFTPGTRTFMGTPAAGDAGTIIVLVRAQDPQSWITEDEFDIVVTTPGTPVITITGGSAVTEGTDAAFTVNANPAPTSPLTVNLTVADAPSADFVAAGDLGTKMVTIAANAISASHNVPTTGGPGEIDDEPSGSVMVTVDTGSGYTLGTTKEASVTVNDNDATVVTLARTGSGSVNEGGTVEFTVTLERVLIAGEIIDVPLAISGTNVTTDDWSLTRKAGSSLNKGVSLSGTSTEKPTVRFTGHATDTVRTATLVLTAEADGTSESQETLTIELGSNSEFDANALGTNVGGGADPHGTTNTFDVVVNNVNNTAPTVANAIPDQTVSVGSAFSYQFPANTFTDADNDALTYTVTGNPAWLSFTSSTRTFTGTPLTTGTHTVTVTADDTKGGTDTDDFAITVSATPPPNTTPTVANAIPDQTATPGTLFSLNITGNFTDADGDTLSYSATQSDDTALPSWLSLSPTGVFSGTPPVGFTSVTVRVTATDPDGMEAMDEFTIGQPTEGTSDSLVRFGRTLGVQAVNTITDRLSTPRQIGLTGQVAGQTLSNGQRPNQQQNTLATNPPKHTPGGADPLGEATTIATDTLQTGTAFTYTEETPHGTTISYWGQGTRSSFASENITDGKVTTLAFGTDWHKDKRTYGLMLARSSGDIVYRQGSIERTMTTRMRAIIPYGGMELANNLSLWGAFGLGQGELTLKPLDDTGDEQTTDLDWQMVASGIRGNLSSLDLLPGTELGWRADALWTRTSSDEQEGLPATRSKSTRLRVGLEMGWEHQLASSTIVRPYMGIDILHDGGDAETGLGVDVSGGVDWFDPAKGLTVGISGHKVIHHVDDAYESWGLSFSLAYDPRPATKEGFSAVVSHAVDREEVVGTASLVGTTPDIDNPVTMDRNWQMEAAYGTARAEGMVGSSYTRVRGSDDPEDLRVGYRIEPDTEIAEDLTVDTWASSPLEDGVASNAAGVDLVWRW